MSLSATYFALPVKLGLLVAPFLIAIGGAVTARRMARRKWIAHTIALGSMFFATPVYIEIGGFLDPTSIELPGPADPIFYSLCFLIAGLTMFGYALCIAVFALVSLRRTRSHARSPA